MVLLWVWRNYWAAPKWVTRVTQWSDYARAKDWIYSSVQFLPLWYTSDQASKTDVAVRRSWHVWSCPKEERKTGRERWKQRQVDRWKERHHWFIACQRAVWWWAGDSLNLTQEQRYCCSLDHYFNHMWLACRRRMALMFWTVVNLTSQFATTKGNGMGITQDRCDCQANNRGEKPELWSLSARRG